MYIERYDQLLLSNSSMITSPATVVKMTGCTKYNTVDCYLILSAPMHHLTGYCSLDGLEKVTTPMCALPKSRVIAGQDTETKMLFIHHQSWNTSKLKLQTKWPYQIVMMTVC